MPAITAQAPGKTILFGEHAVVYGFPAIAVPLNCVQLKVSLLGAPGRQSGAIRIFNRDSGEEFLLPDLPDQHPLRAALRVIADGLKVNHLPAADLTISSTIPVASGLGSSAALAVSLARVFSQFLGFNLPDSRVNELAYEIEKFQHGTPSGIDNSVVAFNRPVYFIKGQPPEFLTFTQPLTLVVADTGIRSLTRDVVADVKRHMEEKTEDVKPLLSGIGEIALSAKKKLTEADLAAIGSLMNENHHFLYELGVSCQELERLVRAARQAGAWGAKLCGGGRGGNMIALTPKNEAERIRMSLIESGAVKAFIAEVQ